MFSPVLNPEHKPESLVSILDYITRVAESIEPESLGLPLEKQSRRKRMHIFLKARLASDNLYQIS